MKNIFEKKQKIIATIFAATSIFLVGVSTVSAAYIWPAWSVVQGNSINASDIVDLRTATTKWNFDTLTASSNIFYDGTGNVGIGTTTPTSKLQTQYVNATAYNTTFSDGYGYIASEIDGVSITNADTSILNGFTSLHFRHNGSSGNAAGRMVLGNQSAGNGFFAFQLRDGSNTTNTQEVLRIKSDGNVGIGTTTPAKKLDVAGDINFTGDLYDSGVLVSLGDISNFNLVGTSILGKWSGAGSTGDDESTGVDVNLFNHYLGVGSGNINSTGGYNTANGYESLLLNTTGSLNTANGLQSLYSNTTGDSNTANGLGSLYSNTTGDYNTANGHNSGRFTSSLSPNQTSSDSVYLGYDTRSSASGNVNEVVIGHTAIGNGSNTVTLGNDSITDTYLKGDIYQDGVLFTGEANFNLVGNSILGK
jgi:hypothetical protein